MGVGCVQAGWQEMFAICQLSLFEMLVCFCFHELRRAMVPHASDCLQNLWIYILSKTNIFMHQHLQRGTKWFLKGFNSPTLIQLAPLWGPGICILYVCFPFIPFVCSYMFSLTTSEKKRQKLPFSWWTSPGPDTPVASSLYILIPEPCSVGDG